LKETVELLVPITVLLDLGGTILWNKLRKRFIFLNDYSDSGRLD
jgi:hypothetical protein